jgi:hypothetical protein
MSDARLYIEENVEPAVALARSWAAWQKLDSDVPICMYGATLRGDAWLLGAHQLASQALRPEPHRGPLLLRRATGGVTLRAGDGIVYVALGLQQRSALMPCPRSRILNRNVRGALQGLRLAGVTAHYFGRDFLSVDACPASYVGWAAQSDGRVLLEFFLCEQSSCFLPEDQLGYPLRRHDPFRGKQPMTLAAAAARRSGRPLIEAIANGYRAGFKAEFRPGEPFGLDPSFQPQLNEPDPDNAGLAWSHPLEEAIGFVSAGVALDGAGKLAKLRVRGDFFAAQACAVTLERMLVGVEPSSERIGRAVDAAYGQGGHDVEGIKDLHSFQISILDAVARARDPS